MIRIPAALVILVLVLISLPVRGDEGATPASRTRHFEFAVETVTAKAVKDLRWYSEQATITEAPGGKSAIVTLPGEAKSLRGGTFIYGPPDSLRRARIDEKTGKFTLVLDLKVGSTDTSIRAIDSYGKLYSDGLKIRTSARETVDRFSFDVGVGASYLSYSERRAGGDVKIRELGITPKFSVGYRLNPKWDLSANTFFTAIPLKLGSDPAILTAARWYGVNGRIGRVIYQSGLSKSLTANIGWYFWGMLTSASSSAAVYGVDRLSGPQAFFVYRARRERGNQWFVYGKYAIVQAPITGYSFANREAAIGGGYQPWIGSPTGKRWMVTLDLVSTKTYAFELLSASLGISRRL